MRIIPRALALFVILLSRLAGYSQTCTMQGVYTIGPSGNYLSLTSAITALRAGGVSGDVFLELQAAYSSAVESFPLRFKNIPCIDSSRSVTVRPAAGATALTITSNSTGTVDLDSTRFIRFDGRPGGAGTAKELTISNTNANGIPLRFSNDASWNQFGYLIIQGRNSSALGGVVHFSVSGLSVSNGNSYNRIINCSIQKSTANPVNCIYSQGSPGKKNRNNEILNCDISDFWAASGATNGIYLGTNNSDWRIGGNSIFHSAQLNFSNSTLSHIFINDTTSSGFVIENNFIGGSSANCGGSAITYGTFFKAIRFMVGSSSYTSVQGNTLANFNINFSASGGAASAIFLGLGKFRCGDITGNTVGSQTTTNSIQILANNFIGFYGITAGMDDNSYPGVDTCYIKNNKIGGIYAYLPAATTYSGPIAGIYIPGQKKGQVVISENTIGSPSVYGSIANNVYLPSGNGVTGIHVEVNTLTPAASRPENIIQNNRIVNLRGTVTGINVIRGRFSVLNNKIENLSSMPQMGGGGLSVTGIVAANGNSGAIVSGNVTHSLTCIGTVNNITGINIQSCPGVIISKNYVHSLQSSSASENNLTGLNINTTGYPIIINNMIRLGMDTLGNSVSANQKIFGVYLQVDSSFMSNNTFYMGGGATGESATLMIPSGTLTPGKIFNNIIVNRRVAISGAPRNHYAVRIDNSVTTFSRLNHNIYYSGGTNSYIGIYKGVAYSSIISWRNALKADSNSIHFNPNFVNPEGNAATGNLHLVSPTPAEAYGVLDPIVTDDFDNENRAALSPTDIGADAGNFIYKDGDPPILSHDPFFGQPVVSSFVYKLKVTDNGLGVDTSGSNKPRMWFRKKNPTYSSWESSPGNLLTGTIKNGIWGFSPDFPAAGIPINVGDTIEYYFVAQDRDPVPNVGYSNLIGTVHTNVNTQVSAPTSPLRLLIYGIFPDTVYVGTGQTYTSLTNDGGFFQAAKTNFFDSTTVNHVVIIVSNLLETGKHIFSNLNQGGNSTLTISTNTAVIKTIKNSTPLGIDMVRFLDTKNVTIDGSINGNGRYLQFTNARTDAVNTQAAVVIKGSKNHICLLRNTILEANGSQSFSGVLSVSSFGRAENNLIRHASGFSLPGTAINLGGSSGDTAWLVNNDITNFSQTGVRVGGSGTAPTCIIDSNHFYYDPLVQAAGSKKAIELNSGSVRCLIKNNFIGGTARNCGGAPWSFNTGGGTFDGMYIIGSYSEGTSIQNNTIQNIRFNSLTYHFTGITIGAGNTDVGTEKPNLVGSTTTDSSIVNPNGGVTGIYGRVDIYTGNFPQIRINNNQISGMTGNSAIGIDFEGKPASFRNNTISTLRGNGIVGMRILIEGGSIEANTVSNLVIPTSAAGTVSGIDAGHTSSVSEVVVSRNKIYGLEVNSASNGLIIGLRTGAGRYTVYNNQVNLSNGLNNVPAELRGLYFDGYGGTARISRVYYNSVRISGSVSSGTSKSYAVMVNQNFPVAYFRNNLLYNERSGGTGLHVALGNVSGTNPPISTWPAGNSTNNLFVTADTSAVNEWRASGVVSLSQWRILSGGDTASYAASIVNVPSNRLFISVNTNNLNINNLDSICWYSNGKGFPVNIISGDFDSSTNTRSTSIVTGATDIGADEFNTATVPLVLKITGSHSNGGTEYFSFGGRFLANIKWGLTGTLPALQPARFYSGMWPNDTLNNNTVFGSHYLNSYWNIPASGGSNYTYDLQLNYDSSMLGKVTDASTMIINKKQSNVAGSWTAILPTVVNTTAKTITISNQNSFSEFTATDSSATLAIGGPLPDLVILNQTISTGSAGTGSEITVGYTEANNGDAAATAHKVYFYLSGDAILTPGQNNDTVWSSNDIAGLAANSNVGALTATLKVACTLAPGNYYVFIVSDGANTVFESNENNNSVSLPLTVSAGISVPATPVISLNPGATVCSPATITLTANSPGCTSCSYSWNTAASGASITVNSSGNYTVTASNACGSSNKSQVVTVNSSPVVSVSATVTSICEGDSVEITATGASTYSWTGPGLKATSGASVFAVPSAAGNSVYSVTGTSNSCTSQPKTITITVNPLPDVQIAENDTSICNGSSITLNASGAVSYNWNPTTGLNTSTGFTVMATPAATTTYVVTGLSSQGCIDADSITITLLPTVIPLVTVSYTGCPSNTLNFLASPSNGGSSPQYQWFVNNVSAGTGPTFTLNNATNNTKVLCKLLSNANCAVPQTAEDSVTVNCITTALPEIDGLEEFTISPNPTPNQIQVYIKLNQAKKVSYTLFDVNGNKLYEESPAFVSGINIKTIDLSRFQSGVYFLKISIGKDVVTSKVIKVK